MSPKSKDASAAGTSRRDPSKSKRIRRARKELASVPKAHAELTAGSGVSLKKAQRANAKLASAAAAYAEAVQAKTGLESAFVPGSGQLDGATISSLQTERAAIERTMTGSLRIVPPAPPEDGDSGE